MRLSPLLLLSLFLIVSCGKDNEETLHCRPQEIAIAECLKEEWEKESNQFLIELHKERCKQRFLFNICYDY